MELLIWILVAYGMSQILVYGSILITPESGFHVILNSWRPIRMYDVYFYLGRIFFISGIYSPTESLISYPYTNIFFDGILASGSVWALNAIIEWFEENKPPKD